MKGRERRRILMRDFRVLFHINSIFVSFIGEEEEEARTKTWKTQVEKESKSVGLEKEDAMNRARWRVGVREIAAGVNPATPVYGDKRGSKLD